MVVAWHHWRKVSRLERPRGLRAPARLDPAPSAAARARWWARQKDLDPESRATLDALGEAVHHPAQGAAADPPHRAADRRHGARGRHHPRHRRAGAADGERAVRRAPRRPVHRASGRVLEALAPALESVRWPRPSIIMRAGSARRRAHTAVGVATAVAAVLVSGSLVTDAAGVRPGARHQGHPRGQQHAGPAAAGDAAAPAARPAEPGGAAQRPAGVARRSPATGPRAPTTATPSGDGLVFTCQGGRYADMRGIGALVRTFTGPRRSTPKAAGRRRPLTAGQSAEASADEDAGERTYKTTARLVRRLRQSRGSSCSRPTASRASATRRRCWCCATGPSR